MSILINGMEMPKGCAFCQIGKRNGKKMVCPLCDEEWDIHDPMSADHRLDNCPLVSIPPHGRLGDLDTLMKQVEHDTPLSDVFEKTMRRYLHNAPTVIPAEEGE